MHTLVVVPTYNERITLPMLVDAMPQHVDVLVVDDNSPDGTGTVADQLVAAIPRVHVLHRACKSGLGSAYREGFAWGLARGYDAIGEIDADLSHDPRDVPRLVAALDRCDLAIGSRYVPGGAVHAWPAHRLLLSRGGNAYVRALTGLPLADATAGFRVYRRAVLERIDLGEVHAEGYAFQLDMALRAWRLGFRIVEIPITFTERTEGASKMSRAIVVEALWRVLAWGVAGPRHPAPRPHPHSIAAS